MNFMISNDQNFSNNHQDLLNNEENNKNRTGYLIRINKIKNLKNINCINWNEILNTTFYKSIHKKIDNCNLILLAPTKINSIRIQTLNQIPIKNYFTLTTEQHIYSNIVMPRFYIKKSLTTNSLNGLDVEHDIARIGINNYIKCKCMIIDN